MQEKSKNNYEMIAEAARAIFLKWDQKKMTSRAGIDSDENFIFINYFNEKYSISRTTGEILRESGGPVDHNAIMVIYDVICNSKPDAALSREWLTHENLNPHSNFGSMEKSLFGPAAEGFSGHVDELRAACANLGGFDIKKADAGFMFNAFQFLPVLFQFWEGDDEFAPKVTFHFDRNTLDFVCFESAWYIVSHLIEIIRAEMDAQFSMGFYGR